MDDQEFLDYVISEKMQQLYASEYPTLTEDELAVALQLETEYNHALETLPPELTSAITHFVEYVTTKSAKETVFFYKKGLHDGLLLYRTLENL